MQAYYSFLARKSCRNYDEVFKFAVNVSGELRKDYSVNPIIHMEAARITALWLGLDYYSEEIQSQVEQLLMIYQGEGGKLLPGVLDTLNLFRACDTPVHIFTHGSDDFTVKKLRGVGLEHYPYGKVFSIDSRSRKDEHALRRVLQSSDLIPSEVIIVGDDWTSDITPAIRIGVPPEQIFRVKTDYEIANKEPLPGIRQIDSFSDLPLALVG
jgi:FMN phosphatase YigB (HAD superfamily)